MPSAACSAAAAIELGVDRAAAQRLLGGARAQRDGPMWVRPIRTSSHCPSEAFTRAQTPTIAQSSERRANFS